MFSVAGFRFCRSTLPRFLWQGSDSAKVHCPVFCGRVQILQKYGGVYQDRDVVWAGRLPDELLRYPAVLCPDWPRNGEWPESFNTGVLMAQRRAPFLRHFLSTLRHFLDHSHAFNAVMMPYRAYERHPDSLHVDRYLQVKEPLLYRLVGLNSLIMFILVWKNIINTRALNKLNLL